MLETLLLDRAEKVLREQRDKSVLALALSTNCLGMNSRGSLAAETDKKCVDDETAQVRIPKVDMIKFYDFWRVVAWSFDSICSNGTPASRKMDLSDVSGEGASCWSVHARRHLARQRLCFLSCFLTGNALPSEGPWAQHGTILN